MDGFDSNRNNYIKDSIPANYDGDNWLTVKP